MDHCIIFIASTDREPFGCLTLRTASIASLPTSLEEDKAVPRNRSADVASLSQRPAIASLRPGGLIRG
jgi:hypothetical protein